MTKKTALPLVLFTLVVSVSGLVGAAPKYTRQPGVEKAAEVILKTPDLRWVLLSAERCMAKDRLLEALAVEEPTAEIEKTLSTLRVELAATGRKSPVACDDEEVALIIRCSRPSPELWCRFNYRVDAFVRASEIRAGR